MADKLSKERRSWNMSRIKSRDTQPEKIVRSVLHRKGYRFRTHRKDLPGNPDIVLPKFKTIIMVHGCFWHRHQNCKYAYSPKSRIDFWEMKFQKNLERDSYVREELSALGWTVHVIWECQTKQRDVLESILEQIFK